MTKPTQYFEDLKADHKWVSQRRTITETDIVMFAGLTGDYNPLHTDEEFAKQGLFGKRIAHGLLGLSYSAGLPTSETPWMILAFMGLEWKFTKPIFIGDTVYAESQIAKTREVGADRGIVVVDRKLINQAGEVVQEGTLKLLVKKREA